MPAGAYNMNMFIIRRMLKMLLVLVASEGYAVALGIAYSYACIAIFAPNENVWDRQRNQAETLGIMLPAAGFAGLAGCLIGLCVATNPKGRPRLRAALFASLPWPPVGLLLMISLYYFYVGVLLTPLCILAACVSSLITVSIQLKGSHGQA